MNRFIHLLLFLFLPLFASAQVRVYVHLDTSITQTLTGRLYLFCQSDTTKPINDQPDFSRPQAFYAKPVSGWRGDQVQVFTDGDEALSLPLRDLPPGYYKAAALIDVNEEERAYNFSPGNAYSRKDVVFYVDSTGKGEAHLYINAVIGERPFRETEQIKLLSVKSDLLSAFHGKEVRVKAAVILPEGYSADSAARYPVVFVIPGWGGTHYDALRGSFVRNRYGMGMGKKKVYVYLNPETQTRWGLHAFVDSRVNGPWGRALVEEVIPWLQANYRVSDSPRHYAVMGQSSGGYAALWLQVHYPRAFNGCWAVSPDPVDFSDFTGVNIYRDENFYTDAEGNERPIFFMNGRPLTDMRTFLAHELFFGDGGQLQSFEAEFGKTDAAGRPRQLFDRATGRIDRDVAEDWRPYDLGTHLHDNWPRLAPVLSGKIHVYAGDADNFLLDRPVRLLQQKAAAVNAALTAELIPGADHWSIWSAAFTARLQGEIDARIGG